MTTTAILVDGGFYLRRSKKFWGRKSPRERADELHDYCLKHITVKRDRKLETGERSLYRIFYYDCPPLDKGAVKQPWSAHNTVFSAANPSNKWTRDFHSKLSGKRKVAMRMGELNAKNAHYTLREESLKQLLSGTKDISQLGEQDFVLVGLKQTGVDMRIGLDVAVLGFSRLVDQIILVAGDSDFIPVAKAARKAGIDFIIDPMGNNLSSELIRQVDGIEDLTKKWRPVPADS